jgi:multiple sugar transport system substrate-binding protein
LTEEFHQRTGISVAIENGVTREEMARRLARGKVDVITLSSSELASLSSQGLLASLEKAASEETKRKFYPATLAAGKVGEELYGLPLYGDVPVVYYNREIFQRFGVSVPSSGWGWDDYVERAKALTRDTDGDGSPNIYGVCRLGELDALVAQEGLRLFSAEGDPKAIRCQANSAAVRGLLEFYLALDNRYHVCPPQDAKQDPLCLFCGGKVAMLTSSASWAGALMAATDFDCEIATVPTAKLGKGYRLFGVTLLSISRGSRRQAEAWRFVNFACEWEGCGNSGGIPAAKSITESQKLQSLFPPGMKKVVAGLGGYLPPREPFEREFLQTIWQEQVGKVLKGQQSLDGALLDMERKGNEMLGGGSQ